MSDRKTKFFNRVPSRLNVEHSKHKCVVIMDEDELINLSLRIGTLNNIMEHVNVCETENMGLTDTERKHFVDCVYDNTTSWERNLFGYYKDFLGENQDKKE